jgi:acetylornithine deacetylase
MSTTTNIFGHLAVLVACRTENPPRNTASTMALFDHVRATLSPVGFVVDTVDHGDGCLHLRAQRGVCPWMVNVHTDTVPVAEGWAVDPFVLHLDGDRAVGLGACDTKGALAAFLVAAQTARGPADLLLSSDEEAGNSTVIRRFTADNDLTHKIVVVAEPTRARAVIVPMPLCSQTAVFSGTPGHASSARASTDSAVHALVRWSAAALTLAEQKRIRLNLGTVQGGTKPNMIAGSASTRFGIRTAPGEDPSAILRMLSSLSTDGRATFTENFIAPGLPAHNQDFFDSMKSARRFADQFSIPIGEPVDFFTEAALFSLAGATTFVYGAGDIAQAHTANEFVALDDLLAVHDTYLRMMSP